MENLNFLKNYFWILALTWLKTETIFRKNDFQKILFFSYVVKKISKFSKCRKKLFAPDIKMMGQKKTRKSISDLFLRLTGREIAFENFFKSIFFKNPKVLPKVWRSLLDKYLWIWRRKWALIVESNVALQKQASEFRNSQRFRSERPRRTLNDTRGMILILNDRFHDWIRTATYSR